MTIHIEIEDKLGKRQFLTSTEQADHVRKVFFDAYDSIEWTTLQDDLTFPSPGFFLSEND